MSEFIDSLSPYWIYLVEIWNLQLVEVDGGGITIGKLVFALVLATVGFFISRIFSRQLERRLLQRFRLARGATAAIESLIFYLIFFFFLLFALKLANVPLTIFTVLGGALAIGVGFGSQNLMNNFISGVILLIEQPIRAGDIIEVDNLFGRVVKIGTRSTIVRMPTNIEIVIPNSSFLEKNVVNWTLTDQQIRMKIVVGVAYGSNLELVKEKLLEAVESHDKILKEPEPFVWFMDFGDSALTFEVHFWGLVNVIGSKLTIESDIRFKIDQLFKEAGITIAFPQRDVHLDLTQPLDVRVVGEHDKA